MENRPMSLLLVEDDEFECKNFKAYVESLDNVKLVGITNSSDKAIELFKTNMPEAIILDIELHKGQGSGLEFVENIKKYTNEFRPIIVVTTNASSSVLYDKLHDEGVDLIFYKKQSDYSPKLIVSTLLSLRKSLYKHFVTDNSDKVFIETEAERKDKISNKINAELDLIGISSHLKGRDYINDAIMYLVENIDTKDNESVFNHVASLYKVTSSSVSRVMQTAINYAWRNSSPEDLETHYTAKINYHTGVPSPTELIYHYAKKISKNI